MSCNKCETKKCSCGKGSTPVMPPSECNTPTCPDPAPCSEIIPTACIQYVGEAKLCGEDEVFAEGDTIGVIEEKIVDYFCERLSSVSEEVVTASTIVTQVDCGEGTVYETGDTIIEALEKTVGYFCTELSNINDVISGLATVASSGAYSDLSGLPTALSDFSNDLLTADELAAINGASTPSALNTFATINDIPTAVSELSNDAGFVTKNLYTADDTLTSNRTVTGGGFSLTFTGQSNFKVISPSASILDTAFAVRNNTNTNNHFQVLGNGSVYSSGKNYAIQDTVYGYNAGGNMGAGAYFNTFFGFQAGANVAGAGCVAVGTGAMIGNSTFSVAVGSGALENGGLYSVAIGSNAIFQGVGPYNVAIGQNVGYELTIGSENTFVGTSSGRAITTGSYNIHVGSGVNGALGITTGSKNTIISAKTTGLPATLTGSTIIGYGAASDGNNQFSVGSVEQNAGAVVTEGFTQALTWAVTINGVKYKIPLQLA